MARRAAELELLDERAAGLGVAGDVVVLEEIVAATVDTDSIALLDHESLALRRKPVATRRVERPPISVVDHHPHRWPELWWITMLKYWAAWYSASAPAKDPNSFMGVPRQPWIYDWQPRL